MFTEREIVKQFKAGASKKYLAESIYYSEKNDKHKITKTEAMTIVEKALLDDYIKNLNKAG